MRPGWGGTYCLDPPENRRDLIQAHLKQENGAKYRMCGRILTPMVTHATLALIIRIKSLQSDFNLNHIVYSDCKLTFYAHVLGSCIFTASVQLCIIAVCLLISSLQSQHLEQLLVLCAQTCNVVWHNFICSSKYQMNLLVTRHTLRGKRKHTKFVLGN